MIRAAVIGVGNIGAHHARIYSAFNDVELVGVCDVNATLGKKIAKQYNTTYFNSYKKLFEKKRVDLLSIAVPTSFHAEVALYALDYVSNILIEKPIAGTVADAKKIIKKSQQKRANIYVGYVERFNPVLSKLEKLLKDDTFGKILSVSVTRVGLYPPRVKGADVLTDLATHDIDLLYFLLKKLPKILAVSGGKMLTDTYDYAQIFLQYGTTPSFIQTNWVTPVKIREIEITGSKGYATVDYLNQKITHYSTPFNKEFKDFGEFIIKFGTPHKKESHIQFEEPLKRELRSFVDSVQKRKPTTLATGLEALQILTIAENAIKKLDKKNI